MWTLLKTLSSVLHCFEHGNAFETYNGNFYLGLPYLKYNRMEIGCIHSVPTLGIYRVDKLSVMEVILRYGTKFLHQ